MQDEFVSKTKRKKEMLELQALGAALVELPASQIEGMRLDAALAEAVLEAKAMSSHEARRRQMQYIGRLMRDVDPAPIRARLEELTGHSAQAAARHKRLEVLREKLLEDDNALTEYCAAHPSIDLPALRALIRNSRKEKKEGKPPRAYRELFRLLKSIESGSALQG